LFKKEHDKLTYQIIELRQQILKAPSDLLNILKNLIINYSEASFTKVSRKTLNFLLFNIINIKVPSYCLNLTDFMKYTLGLKELHKSKRIIKSIQLNESVYRLINSQQEEEMKLPKQKQSKIENPNPIERKRISNCSFRKKQNIIENHIKKFENIFQKNIENKYKLINEQQINQNFNFNNKNGEIVRPIATITNSPINKNEEISLSFRHHRKTL